MLRVCTWWHVSGARPKCRSCRPVTGEFSNSIVWHEKVYKKDDFGLHPFCRLLLVPVAGLEPARGFPHRILSATRLPFHHTGIAIDNENGSPAIGRSVRQVVGESGFEPPKSLTTDLQSAPFGRSGTPPDKLVCVGGPSGT